MALLKVNGVELPSPSKYKVKRSDLDSEATMRNSEGYLIRDRVREGVYRIDVSWEALTHSDYLTVVNALSPAKFTVVFWDPNSATTKTAQMYAGDRDSELILLKDGQKSIVSLSCALIEY
jgi:hypothetical protein